LCQLKKRCTEISSTQGVTPGAISAESSPR